MLEKIEKIVDFPFPKQNDVTSLTHMQSFLYNLKNLQTFLNQPPSSSIINPSIRYRRPESQFLQNYKQNKSQLSVGNIKNSIFTPQNSISSSLRNSSRSFKSQCKMQKTAMRSSVGFGKIMRNMLISQKIGKQNENEQKMNESKKIGLNFNRMKNNKFRCKIVPILSKNQRFFQDKQVDLDEKTIEKLGLYEASNIYKPSNVSKFIKNKYTQKLKPVINLKFSTFKTCNRNQFFLTENTQLQINQSPYLETTRIKPHPNEQDTIINTHTDQCEKYIDQILQESHVEEKIPQKTLFVQKNEWIVTFNNYKIEKDENFYIMRTKNIQNWSDINFIIIQVQKYLKKVKIMHLSFKFQIEKFLQHFWVCKKVNEKELAKLLRINLKIRQKDKNHEEIKIKRLFSCKEEVIKQLIKIWKDRKNLSMMKKEQKSKKQIINWIGLRMVVKFRVRKQKQKALKVAKDLNRRLKIGDWDHDVQIYIPSFSEPTNIREGTQYMDYYENIFYQIWNNSEKQIVLILPAVNENILSFLKERTRISNNVTIICPQTHQLYPKTLPLAACLLYSSVAINKLRAILDGKKGVIIPGRNLSFSNTYQIKLSHMLVCPLYCPLNKQNDLHQNKRVFQSYLSSIPFRSVKPNCEYKSLIQNLAELISKHPKVSNWIFKIDGQFNGRGFAFFNVSSSKKLMKILQIEENEQSQMKVSTKIKNYLIQQVKILVIEYLETYFRLKLKVNFQNTIFRTDQYIESFMQKGGVIQEMIEDCDTYQLCFLVSKQSQKTRKISFLNIVQIFPIDFVVRSSLYGGQIPQALNDVKKKLQKMLCSQQCIGYVSIILLWNGKRQEAYGVEIKYCMTPNCSIGFFINNINNSHGKVSDTSSVQSFTQITTQRDKRNHMSFLFIPAIIFTDVDEMAKCELIQALTIETWQNLSTQLLSSCIFVNDSDCLCGSFYLSMGLTLGLLLYSRSYDVKKLKKLAVQSLRVLSQKINGLKKVNNYQTRRDVFQLSDIIRSITSIKI